MKRKKENSFNLLPWFPQERSSNTSASSGRTWCRRISHNYESAASCTGSQEATILRVSAVAAGDHPVQALVDREAAVAPRSYNIRSDFGGIVLAGMQLAGRRWTLAVPDKAQHETPQRQVVLVKYAAAEYCAVPSEMCDLSLRAVYFISARFFSPYSCCTQKIRSSERRRS